MKKNLFFAFAFGLTLVTAKAQQNNFWNKTSVEVGYGYALTLSPTDHFEVKDYANFQNYQVGLNYNFNNQWGVRLTYMYQNFENNNSENLGSSFNKFMASATYNVMTVIDQSADYRQNKFDFEAYAGVGGSFMHLNTYNTNTKVIHAQIGLKPMYEVYNGVNVFLDANYTANFKQLYGIDGYYAKPDGKDTTGGTFNALVGIQVKLGN